jgi:acyl-CoA thioesterase
MTPQERASRAAQAMWASDAASAWVGLSLDAIGPGTARMSLTVAPLHLNGHGICQGGGSVTLAARACAVACNSHNRIAVAQHNSISYLSPGRGGEVLTADATETALTGRTGLTDVTVTGEDGRIVALFRGASRQIAGAHFTEDAAGEDT